MFTTMVKFTTLAAAPSQASFVFRACDVCIAHSPRCIHHEDELNTLSANYHVTVSNSNMFRYCLSCFQPKKLRLFFASGMLQTHALFVVELSCWENAIVLASTILSAIHFRVHFCAAITHTQLRTQKSRIHYSTNFMAININHHSCFSDAPLFAIVLSSCFKMGNNPT